MKQIILYLFFIMLYTSCGKSLYYAYQEGNDYYSIEVNSKNEKIYRAHSKIYDSLYNSPYIYIYEKYYYFDRGEIKKDTYEEKEIVFGFTKIFYISKEEVLKCSVYGEGGKWDLDGGTVFYEMRGDSIVTDYREMTFNLPKKETAIFLQKKRCKKVSYTKFFPKYMLKVDKIDYKKLQTGNYTKRELKYPHKTKNIKGW